MIACFVWFFWTPDRISHDNCDNCHNLTILTRIPNLNPRKSWGEARPMETEIGCKTCDGTDSWSQSTSLHFSVSNSLSNFCCTESCWSHMKSECVCRFDRLSTFRGRSMVWSLALGPLPRRFANVLWAQHGVCQLVDFLLLPTISHCSQMGVRQVPETVSSILVCR